MIQPKLAKTVQNPPVTTSHASKPPSGNSFASGLASACTAFSEAAIDGCIDTLSINGLAETFGWELITSDVNTMELVDEYQI